MWCALLLFVLKSSPMGAGLSHLTPNEPCPTISTKILLYDVSFIYAICNYWCYHYQQLLNKPFPLHKNIVDSSYKWKPTQLIKLSFSLILLLAINHENKTKQILNIRAIIPCFLKTVFLFKTDGPRLKHTPLTNIWCNKCLQSQNHKPICITNKRMRMIITKGTKQRSYMYNQYDWQGIDKITNTDPL